jgi:sec-independent protein translocase protein TatB
MFENLNVWEVGALLLLALLIFGDRLPNVISDGMRMLRNLRNMASNATSDLSKELGTDIQLEDLHPKTFIRKHLLSEEDEQALRKPLQGIYDDIKGDLNKVKGDLTSVKGDLDGVAKAMDPRSAVKPVNGSSSAALEGTVDSNPAPAPRRHTYDTDAT